MDDLLLEARIGVILVIADIAPVSPVKVPDDTFDPSLLVDADEFEVGLHLFEPRLDGQRCSASEFRDVALDMDAILFLPMVFSRFGSRGTTGRR